jgi:hypothetical protein
MSDAKRVATAAVAGYSGKPLWQKLGLKPQLRALLRRAPAEYWDWCGFDPRSVRIVSTRASVVDFAHLFATARVDLERDLLKAATVLDYKGMLWISWPKKSSGIVTDITEGTLRELALPLGLVDVKVCAVTEVWSGLKFVWRIEQRALSASSARTSR